MNIVTRVLSVIRARNSGTTQCTSSHLDILVDSLFRREVKISTCDNKVKLDWISMIPSLLG